MGDLVRQRCSVLRQICFIALFDLRTLSFANLPVCVNIANLLGKVGQNISGGQFFVNVLNMQFNCHTSYRHTTIAIIK